MSRYFIHEDNIEKVETRISKINKKCEKFGCNFNYQRVGEEFRNVSDIPSRPNIQKFIEIEVEGVAVISDWDLIAKIEHEEEGCVISKIQFDAEIPEKYMLSDYDMCEHCNSNRRRKVVYILRNSKTGEFKQVGSSCLKDFTGVLDAENAARFFAMFDELDEADGVYIEGSGKPYYSLRDYLRYCVECVNKFGWFNSSSMYSTANRAWDYFSYKELGRSGMRKPSEIKDEMEAVNFDASEEHHGAKVDSILEFVKNMEDNSSYVVSIKSLANSDYFSSKFTGFVASMVICYNKAMEKERKQKEEEAKVNLSEYIGNKGDRMEANFKEVKVVASYDTQFGMMMMYRFVLDNDNICVWSTGNYINTDEVKSGKIKFTVKDHSQFRGVKQTVVTRCKLSA